MLHPIYAPEQGTFVQIFYKYLVFYQQFLAEENPLDDPLLAVNFMADLHHYFPCMIRVPKSPVFQPRLFDKFQLNENQKG